MSDLARMDLAPAPLLRFFAAGTPRPKGATQLGVTATGKAFVRLDNRKGKAGGGVSEWLAAIAYACRLAMGHAGLTLVDRDAVRADLTFCRLRPQAHFDAKGCIRARFASALPTGRPDGDKLYRAVGDALTGVLYRDDSQLTTVKVRKRWARVEGALVEIWRDDSLPDIAMDNACP